MLSLYKHAAVRISSAHGFFSFHWLIPGTLEVLLPVFLVVCINLPVRLKIVLRNSLCYFYLFTLVLVGTGLNVRAIYKYSTGIYKTAINGFAEYVLENMLKNICVSESFGIVFAEGRKMWYWL